MAGGFTINDTPASASASPADIAAAFAGDAEATADLLAALGVAGDPGMPTSGLLTRWLASALALSDGAAVTTWAPSVGSPGSPSGSGSSRPTYRAAGSPAGGACVEFDGSDDELSLSSPAGLPSGAAAGTIVAIVSRAKDNGSYSHIVQYGSSGPAQCRGLGCGPSIWYCLDYQTETASGSDAPRHRRGAVLGHAYDGTTRHLWVDGVPVASTDVALDTGAAALHFGRSVPGGERTAFRLMEVAIYDHALSDAEWARVMAHARAAHGVR